MSPILVRPVREQLEHDRVIRLLQLDLARKKVEVGINPGAEQNASVGATRKEFPDAVLYSTEKGRKLIGVVEVETAESVNHLEAMSQWAHLARLRVPFHLYVPTGSVDVARRLSQDHSITVTEIWAYHQVGEQFKFTLIHPQGRGRSAAAAPRTVSVASIRVEPRLDPTIGEAVETVQEAGGKAEKAAAPRPAPGKQPRVVPSKAATAKTAPAPARTAPPPARTAPTPARTAPLPRPAAPRGPATNKVSKSLEKTAAGRPGAAAGRPPIPARSANGKLGRAAVSVARPAARAASRPAATARKVVPVQPRKAVKAGRVKAVAGPQVKSKPAPARKPAAKRK